jgi:hypothetical protein
MGVPLSQVNSSAILGLIILNCSDSKHCPSCSRDYEHCFNFATHSYFGTISKDALTNVCNIDIKYKSYFKRSIRENAICLLAKRLIHFGMFSVVHELYELFHEL